MTTSPPKKRTNNGQHQPKDSDMYEEKDPDLIPAKYLGTACVVFYIKFFNLIDAGFSFSSNRVEPRRACGYPEK